jgi:uncharacterized protein (DUF1800 family)
MALGPIEAAAAHRALMRFGLGPKASLLAEIVRDPKGALLAEIEGRDAARITTPLPSSQTLVKAFFDEQEAERTAVQARRNDDREMRVARGRLTQPGAAPVVAPAMANGMMDAAAPSAMMMGPTAPPAASQPAPVSAHQAAFRNDAQARFRHGSEQGIGFAERLALFWSNHFCVSISKNGIVRAAAGAMEREAVRPHALGRFADMLVAVEKHPAMIVYLDNRFSVGPGSRAGRNRRGAGLNENLAREILELHTLGVDGGYTQADVGAFARILTGWTLTGPGEAFGQAGAFGFADFRHEPGPQRLLGREYGGDTVAEGEKALADLARHPATAKHLARKLARHFVADEPPAALVQRLADVFTKTDGDLQAMARALVLAPEAWDTPLMKIRTPYEFVMQGQRLFVPPADPGVAIHWLNLLGQPLWNPPGPNGFPDATDHWVSPEGIRVRLDRTRCSRLNWPGSCLDLRSATRR